MRVFFSLSHFASPKASRSSLPLSHTILILALPVYSLVGFARQPQQCTLEQWTNDTVKPCWAGPGDSFLSHVLL